MPTQSVPSPIQISGPTGTVSDTSVAQAQSNAYFAIKAWVDTKNNSLTQDFLTQFNAWSSNYIAGSIGLDSMPVPPKSYVVAFFDDPTTGTGDPGALPTAIQWPYASQVGGPVVAPPPVPQKPAVVAVPQAWFSALGGTVANCPPGDTFPVGFKVTASDGSVWQKMSSPTPFGVAFFYQKVG